MTFQAALKKFLQFCSVERRLSDHTLEAYEFDLSDFEKWMSPGVTPDDIREEDLKLYLEDMVAGRKLSPATVRRKLSCLRSFFRYRGEHSGAKSPFDSWRPKLPRRKRLPRALARSEVLALLKLFAGFPSTIRKTDADLQTALRLMVATGVRVGELCRLGLDDISPDCAVVRVHGKGSRDRIAYVTDASLQEALKALVASHRRNSADCRNLFVNRQGSAMNPQWIRTKLRRYAAEAGVQRRVTPHMLRHTAATLLIETGVDIRFVQRLLGHSSIATTEIYTHVTDEALRATMERANVLGSLQLP